MRTNHQSAQARANNATRLHELLSSGTSDIDKLLEALNISIDELEELYDSDEFTQRDQLQTRLTLFQCRQIGLKLLPELTHRLHQLTESDKPETARRAINTFLNMAGIPTQPVKHPEPPKPTEEDEDEEEEYEEARPNFYDWARERQRQRDQENQDQRDNGQDQKEEPEDQDQDEDRVPKTPEPAQSSALTPQHPVASSPASPVSSHTNQNPIESTVSCNAGVPARPLAARPSP